MRTYILRHQTGCKQAHGVTAVALPRHIPCASCVSLLPGVSCALLSVSLCLCLCVGVDVVLVPHSPSSWTPDHLPPIGS